MKKLEISEMEGVLGGMSVDCKALQALADAYAKTVRQTSSGTNGAMHMKLTVVK